MREVIQIGIPCGRNSEYFVEFLISTIEKTTSGNYDIEFLFGINQSGVDQNFLQNIVTKYPKKFIFSESLTSGPGSSMEHGQLLDLVFSEMDSKYGMMVDCDVAFVCKSWDEKLLSLLDEKTIIVGTEYGSDQSKFMKNPNCIMSLFLVNELKETGLSWRSRSCNLEITEENCQIYGREPGEQIFLDTSCEIPPSLYNSNRSGIAMPLVSPRIDKSKIKFMTEDMRGEEHQLEGTPILTHIGRGLQRSFLHDPAVIKWRQRIAEWLRDTKE